MISVGMGRNSAGMPVMLEKSYPTSERLFYEDGPSMAEQARPDGMLSMFDCIDGVEDEPRRRYSHSTSDL